MDRHKNASSTVTSHNSKQQPTKSECKAKPDQIRLPSQNVQNQLTVSNSLLNNKPQKPSYNDVNVLKSKQDGNRINKKTAPNLIKASSTITSYSNNKQQLNSNENKIVKIKQDPIQLGSRSKENQNQLKVLNSFLNFPPQKSTRQAKINLTKTSTSTVQSQNVRKCEPKTSSNFTQAASTALSKTAKKSPAASTVLSKTTKKSPWQNPEKGRAAANPMRGTSSIASELQKLKCKSDSNLNIHFSQGESAAGKGQNKILESFRTGRSELGVKAKNKTAEATVTELLKPFQKAKLNAKNCEGIEEAELQHYMLTEPALSALVLDLPFDQIKEAIRKKLKQTGTPFASTKELIEAVFKLEKQNQEPKKPTSEIPAAETKLNFAGAEEGGFLDRKILEEIEMLKEEKTCKICLDAEIGIVFIPCGHLVTCVECSGNMKTCPLCRVEIQSTVKTFFS